jgi:hypothetical protein
LVSLLSIVHASALSLPCVKEQPAYAIVDGWCGVEWSGVGVGVGVGAM